MDFSIKQNKLHMKTRDLWTKYSQFYMMRDSKLKNITLNSRLWRHIFLDNSNNCCFTTDFIAGLNYLTQRGTQYTSNTLNTFSWVVVLIKIRTCWHEIKARVAYCLCIYLHELLLSQSTGNKQGNKHYSEKINLSATAGTTKKINIRHTFKKALEVYSLVFIPSSRFLKPLRF